MAPGANGHEAARKGRQAGGARASSWDDEQPAGQSARPRGLVRTRKGEHDAAACNQARSQKTWKKNREGRNGPRAGKGQKGAAPQRRGRKLEGVSAGARKGRDQGDAADLRETKPGETQGRQTKREGTNCIRGAGEGK